MPERGHGNGQCPHATVINGVRSGALRNGKNARRVMGGNGKFSIKDRCRFIGHAPTAALQAAATLDEVAAHCGKVNGTVKEGKALLSDSEKMLVALKRSISGQNFK